MSKFSGTASFQKMLAFGVGERRGLILACLILLFVLLVATWLITNTSQQRLIEFKSQEIANVVATQARTARSVYTTSVVAKLKKEGFGARIDSADHIGSVPIPAQFLKQLAANSSVEHEDAFQFRPLSKWNLSPDQGLKDDFQVWAWEQLEQQQSNTPEGIVDWEPVWRIENVGGQNALRYMVADPAANASCVNCHNSLEQTPEIQAMRRDAGTELNKMWQLNDLMGALEVIVPVHESSALAAAQTRSGLFLVLAVAITGILLVLGISAFDGARALAVTKDLEVKARTDSLTGLPNRAGLKAKVDALLRTSTSASQHAVMLLDLNDFKRINDTLGHHIGDEVLREVAVRLQALIAPPSVFGRLGGDEFVVFLNNVNNQQVINTARAINQALDANIEVDQYRLKSNASIGISMMPGDSQNLSEALRCADVAMYCAKRAKTGYKFYHLDNDHNNLNSLSIITDFKAALDNDGLSMVYQPKFDFERGVVSGAEALLRWEHPERGMISPDRIIPMAEQSDQIMALTRWTVDTSLRQLKQWHDAGRDLKMAVNLSAQMLNADETVVMLLELLEAHDIQSHHLIIEVTETAVMHDSKKAIELLERLRSAGVGISLDDFGTGYSSLSYVNNLPINELKLDRSFSYNLSRRKNKAIVKAVIDLAANVGVELVLEGVEDAGSLALLLDSGGTQMQGYYLCKPIAGDLLTEQLDDLNAVALDWAERKYGGRNLRAA